MSDPNPIPPEGLSQLAKGAPASKAGGFPAIYHALEHAVGQAGPIRAAKALAKLNQIGGYDCPSCAWPDPDGERAVTEFCENGAKAIASETTRKRIGAAFFEKHSVEELAAQSDYWLDQQGRIAEPLLLEEGARHYTPISWEKAFETIGDSLRSLRSPNEALFYTSGRASNEAAFLYQLFVRMFGTNNLPDCSNMCHESSGVALNETIGVGKGTVTLEDLRNAELILVVGQNPGTNHPRMLSTLQQAKERGARIVSINPLREAGLVAFAHPQRPTQVLGGKTPLADTFLQVKLNGDQALFMGIGKALLAHGDTFVDSDFVNEFSSGFDGYRTGLQEMSWERIEEGCGISRSEIEELADSIGRSERIVTCWAMGLTQHRNAVATIQELVNIHLLRGAIGKPGAGLCPVRGHSNVQGDRTMGICEVMPESFLSALDKEFGFESPREEGLNAIHSIRAMRKGEGKAFIALGGNFLSATPDTEYTASALRECDLTVQISTKLNRSHLITGKRALILPCLGRTETDLQESGEQFVTVENSMGIVHPSRGRLLPASDLLKSEVAIVCGIARAALGEESSVDWAAFAGDYGTIRRAIERVVPGFERFEERLAEPGGFYLRNAAKERVFATANGKALFTCHALDIEGAQEGRLLLMTIRSHDQFNTTVYGMDDRYRGIRGERRIVLMNPGDMEKRGLRAEQRVDVVSYFDDEERWARNYLAIPYEIPARAAAMYFPEANVLVPIGHSAKRSDTPASKSVQVDVVAR